MKKITYYLISVFIGLTQTSCKKLVEIDPPQTSLAAESVFSSNSTAIAATTQLYANAAGSAMNSATFLGLSSFPGASADEFLIFGTNTGYLAYGQNTLNGILGTQYWHTFYRLYIYNSNRIIEGLADQRTKEEDKNSKLNLIVKRQLLGEALFVRAFSYFYLIQTYGDVPLLTTTDYVINSTAFRTSKDRVYEQIIQDLKLANEYLSNSYVESDVTTSTSSSPRIRPNRWASKALLARVYLYMRNYPGAEAESKEVIDHNALYSLTTLSGVFLANSTEAIWQLQPVILGRNTQEAWTFLLPTSGPDATNRPFHINPTLLSAFEIGDQRKTSWIASRNVGNNVYYYPQKYKSATQNAPVTEYSTVLRLAEQYLICAEARANLGNISGAQEMLNPIRNRAGLANTTASNKEALLDAILAERRVELFTEFGHRWFDLKRTGKLDDVMILATPQKGGQGWQPFQAYYPIVLSELNLNKNITQTPGY